jgi:hypothetical protein
MDNIIRSFDELAEGVIYAFLKPAGKLPTIFRKTGSMDGTKDKFVEGMPYLYEGTNKSKLGTGRFLRLPQDSQWDYLGYRIATQAEMALLISWEIESGWVKLPGNTTMDNYLIIS